MFAPKVAKPLTTAVVNSTNRPASRNLVFARRPFNDCADEHVHFLRPARDFGQIPIFPADKATRVPERSSLSTQPLPSVIQPKLAVGRVDDPLEHEADRIADQVMRMPDTELASATYPAHPSGKCDACTKGQRRQLKTMPIERAATIVGDLVQHDIIHAALSSAGQPLDRSTRGFMEPRFGHHFSNVRLHTDAIAAASARAVGAAAFTVGQDIVFGAGWFAPQTQNGRRLIAHELSHVIQQSSSGERHEKSGALRLQRFLSPEPAGGCGLCYGLPRLAGGAAHKLIQTEFEILYPLGLTELNVSDPGDESGRLDLAVAVPGGFEIGEIKPANEQGYADGITQMRNI